jgi:DNA-binding transcriptional LysR family regulator
MNLRQFDLNLLVALAALLKERSVTRAGERLHLSQSAMSSTLSRLRHVFGDELLVRVGRHLEPTALAAEIAGPVHDCVQQIETLINSKQSFAPEADSRLFLISASDYAVSLLLGPLVERLTEHAPNVSVRFHALEPTVGDRLAAGDVDFAILPAEFEPVFPSAPLFEDTWTCVAWAGHPTVGDRLTTEEFLALPHLGFSLFDAHHGSQADAHLARIGYERRIVASTASFAIAPFLVRGTRLVTIVPRRLAERLRHPAESKLLDLPVDMPPLCEKLVWNPRFTTSPAHAWMRKEIVQVAKAL